MKKILILTSAILVSVALLAQNPRSQQGERGKEKNEQVSQQGRQQGQAARERAREEAEQVREETREQAREGREQRDQVLGRASDQGEIGPQGGEARGNAYGRNKGGLSGRDFGQARAAAARSKEERQVVTREVALEVEEGVMRTTTRVEQARRRLEEKVENREISREEYEEKNQRIDEIEKEIERIETVRRETERVIRERMPERAPERAPERTPETAPERR